MASLLRITGSVRLEDTGGTFTDLVHAPAALPALQVEALESMVRSGDEATNMQTNGHHSPQRRTAPVVVHSVVSVAPACAAAECNGSRLERSRYATGCVLCAFLCGGRRLRAGETPTLLPRAVPILPYDEEQFGWFIPRL
jgi:hypothetical protein